MCTSAQFLDIELREFGGGALRGCAAGVDELGEVARLHGLHTRLPCVCAPRLLKEKTGDALGRQAHRGQGEFYSVSSCVRCVRACVPLMRGDVCGRG